MPAPARILLVDDDPDARLLMTMTLRPLGEVVAFPDGYQALAWADHAEFDVVVTDLVLPGASGVELLERLSRRGRAPRAVVVTGLVGHQLVDRAVRMGAAVVRKPFRPERLSAAVLAALAPAAA